MELLKPSIKKALPSWNKQVHGETDALVFCEQKRIFTKDTDLIDDLGEYRVHREKPCILLHSYIEKSYRAWVYFHEIGHFILHPTECAQFSDAVTRRKIEKEAHFVAAVALIPTFILKKMRLEEIQEEFGYPRRLILLRKVIYDNYKI